MRAAYRTDWDGEVNKVFQSPVAQMPQTGSLVDGVEQGLLAQGRLPFGRQSFSGLQRAPNRIQLPSIGADGTDRRMLAGLLALSLDIAQLAAEMRGERVDEADLPIGAGNRHLRIEWRSLSHGRRQMHLGA